MESFDMQMCRAVSDGCDGSFRRDSEDVLMRSHRGHALCLPCLLCLCPAVDCREHHAGRAFDKIPLQNEINRGACQSVCSHITFEMLSSRCQPDKTAKPRPSSEMEICGLKSIEESH